MDYTGYESFYGGAISSLEPDFGEYFIGYKNLNPAQIGFPGSAMTANQLTETVNAIKQGVKAFEVTLADVQDVSQTIPKQHFKEMRALMKLSGVKPSVHGPILDSAGFTERGWGGETIRELNERRMLDSLEKAYEIDPSGKMPVVLHASNGTPGAEYVPDKKGEEGIRKTKSTMINLETNQIVPIEEEYKFYPKHPEHLKEGSKGYYHDIKQQIDAANNTEWENKLTDLATFNKHADEVIGPAPVILKDDYENAFIDRKTNKWYKIEGGKEKEVTPVFELSEEEDFGKRRAFKKLKDADIFLDNVQLNFNSAFHKAYKYGSEKQKEELRELAEDYSKNIKNLEENGRVPVFAPLVKRELLDGAINRLSEITTPRGVKGPDGKTREIPGTGAPKIFKEVEEFAMDKTVDTFGNLAIKSYDKFQEKAPILAIENWIPGTAYSRAEDLKKVIEKSREKFRDYLIDEKGMKKKDAEKLAEEKIGVTWDVGHLNVMRKQGFTEKDILEETKKIRPYVRHIHLTDNFGFNDSHLPPGMGNVPIKKILEELEKNERFSEMRKIVEAPNFVQHFKKSPHPFVLSAFGSPIYGMKAGYSWNQVQDVVGSYFGGYGTINPQQHHSLYGAGFTTLPVELGGAMPGTQQGQSRFGGTPMA
ncbi:MAG: TIM barrel protein [Candidatus Pacearchaeota archaeon]